MAHYLVTGGAGFIGSHLSEELVRRGHRVRVADSLITGKRSNLDHLPGVEFLEGDLADLAFANRSRRGLRLRAASGGNSVGAAIGDGSDYVESRERRRNAEHARRSARRWRETARLRRIVVRVRRHADAAEARGHADESVVPIRSAESRRRTVSADVHTALWARDREHPVFQRLRPASGSVFALLRGHFGVCDVPHREPIATHLRRRRADPRLYLRGQCRGRRAACVRSAEGQR